MTNLIDLVSDSHMHLRRIAERRWEEVGKDGMSHTETHLLARLHGNALSISEASRLLNISRQAMQKCAVRLEERGFLSFSRREENRRDKIMALTDRGERFCLQTEKMKQDLEREITGFLGEERIEALKGILQSLDTLPPEQFPEGDVSEKKA